MAAPSLDQQTTPEPGGPGPEAVSGPDGGDTAAPMAVASVILSALGFLTLLRLADRSRPRSPARALGLFLATTVESVSGTALGVKAVTQARDVGRPSRSLLLGAAGAVLGVLTTVLNVNWMRTRRRL